MNDDEEIKSLQDRYEDLLESYRKEDWDSIEHHKLRYSMANCTYELGLLRVKTDPIPEGQKFIPGTFVEVISRYNMGPAMVQYTYSHAYKYEDGHSKELNIRDYSLLCRYKDGSWSEVAWFDVDRLKEITDVKLIEQYKSEILSQKGSL